MSASSDPRAALNDANRRLARLAISWYAADPVQVEKILRQAQQRPDPVSPTELVQDFQMAGLITPAQADNLRLGHAPTQVDIDAAARSAGKNGKPAAAPNSTSTMSAEEPKQLGPYRILRRLGQGGMGAVYLAFDAKENRQVAVKTLSVEHAPKANLLRRFQLEGSNGALLVHANIVRSFAIDQDPDSGLHYIVLEFVDGPRAHDLLDRFGPMQFGDAVHVILDIARALEYAHGHRVIHRDIKPSNILLTSTGVAKLSDLGLAKRRDDASNLTNSSQSIGTPYYMPYEQAMNARLADERSDIYALGATLYHLLTAEVPFAGESSLEIIEKKGIGVYPPARLLVPGLPDSLERILFKMLGDPQDRYQTVSELIVELERSQLAVTIPSFVNRSVALQDPVVQKQWAVPLAPTSPDLQVPRPADNAPVPAKQLWYLSYKDRKGNLCKSRRTTAEILERLQEGKLSTRSEAAHSLQGEFKPLVEWPDFKAVVVAVRSRKATEQRDASEVRKVAARLLRKSRQSSSWKPALPLWGWIAAIALTIALIAILGATTYIIFLS